MARPNSGIVPPTCQLVTGRQDSRRPISARRPRGTSEWLLIFTESGGAYFRHQGEAFTAGGGDVMLIRPGTPQDYGLDSGMGRWKNIWVHFLPRAGCLDWMQWPELSPGTMRLSLPSPARSVVRKELIAMDVAAHSSGHHQQELAVNSLERALILCDSVNPRSAESRMDPRIRKGLDWICLHYDQPVTLGALGRHCGLSRSRLAQLFKEQTGETPLAFLEEQRLRRSHELLLHTPLSLTEIASQTGFSNPFYLSTRFKLRFGQSPRSARRNHATQTMAKSSSLGPR